MKLRDKIEEKCVNLKLTGFMEALDQQLASKTFETKSFLSRLDHLLLAEETSALNKRIKTLQRQAKLRWPNAMTSMIDYTYHPGLEPSKIEDLAELDCQAAIIIISGKEPLIITGAERIAKQKGLNIVATLQKPFDVDEFEAVVKLALDK